MPFEIKTPALRKSLDAALDVIDQLQSGAIDPKEARSITDACKTAAYMCKTDLQIQLAEPRRIAAQAKVIEHDRRELNGPANRE